MIKQLDDIVRNNVNSPARTANALDADKPFTATGTDTYAVTIGLGVTTLNAGDEIKVIIPNANTGTAPTLAVTGASLIGTYNLKGNDGGSLAANDLKVGGQYTCLFDGTNLNVTNLGGGGGGAVSSVNTQTGAVVLDTSDIDPTTNRNYVTDAQQTVISNTSGTNTGDQDLSGKQNVLVSGTSIKTVNSTSLLGSGDVAVQATLVSGTNIKTVNGSSIVGSGDLDLIDDAIVNGESKAPTQNAVFDALALKADLASPTFTGTPAAPTAAAATNTTQLATTAFVKAAVTTNNVVYNLFMYNNFL